jgi:hypothetical protein
MKNSKLKSFSVAFLIITIVGSQFLSVPKASAVLGVGDIVTDPVHTVVSNVGWVEQTARWIWDNAIKVTLQTLKKRLLAIMTDNVVEWINNGYGKEGPKFTQDFGKVFRQAGDAAIGDVLLQYSVTKPLCEPFDFNITFQLQQPAPLADQVRCSLSSVIKSFKDYRNNFKNGGWIGYQELLKPQNNQWGVEIITQNEIINRTAQKTNEAVLKQNVNVGFNSESCTGGWNLIDKRTNKWAEKGPEIDQNTINFYGYIAPGDTYNGKVWDDPSLPPPSPTRSDNFFYRCAGAKITTPGRTLAAGLEKSVWKDFDLLLFNNDDLTNSLAIIADAAFSNLIKSGVKGIVDFVNPKPDSDENRAYDERNRARVEEASGDYESVQNGIAAGARNGYLNQLSSAQNTILAVSSTLATASSINENIITTGQEIVACLVGQGGHPDSALAQYSIEIASSTRATIAGKSAEVKATDTAIKGLVSSVNACADLACLSGTQIGISNVITTVGKIDSDVNGILLSVQPVLADLQIRKTNDCGD